MKCIAIWQMADEPFTVAVVELVSDGPRGSLLIEETLHKTVEPAAGATVNVTVMVALAPPATYVGAANCANAGKVVAQAPMLAAAALRISHLGNRGSAAMRCYAQGCAA